MGPVSTFVSTLRGLSSAPAGPATSCTLMATPAWVSNSPTLFHFSLLLTYSFQSFKQAHLPACSRDKNCHGYVIAICLCVCNFSAQTQVDVPKGSFWRISGKRKPDSVRNALHSREKGVQKRCLPCACVCLCVCVPACAQTLMNVNSRMAAALIPAPTLQEDALATALLLCCWTQTTTPAAVCFHYSNDITLF